MSRYAGVYRAFVVQSGQLVADGIKVQIPHLFGALDIHIPPTHIVGDGEGLPLLGSRGLVAFENAQGDLPVWLGPTMA